MTCIVYLNQSQIKDFGVLLILLDVPFIFYHILKHVIHYAMPASHLILQSLMTIPDNLLVSSYTQQLSTVLLLHGIFHFSHDVAADKTLFINFSNIVSVNKTENGKCIISAFSYIIVLLPMEYQLE